MIIVRLLSPGPWLVGTTKVYSGVGADIVMESITPTTQEASAAIPSALSRDVRFGTELVGLNFSVPTIRNDGVGEGRNRRIESGRNRLIPPTQEERANRHDLRILREPFSLAGCSEENENAQ